MKFSIVWAPAAISSLDAIVAWLEQHWSKKEADQFLDQVFSIIDILRQQPQLYQESAKHKNQHKALITEQISLIYQYKPRKKELHLLLFWDNRQDPGRLRH